MEKRRLGNRAVILAAGFCLAVIAGIGSPSDRGAPAGEVKERSEMETILETPPIVMEALPALTKEQESLYDTLLKRMEESDLAGAASVLEANEKSISELLENTLDKKRYLYNEEGITDDIEGRGIVITSASTLFYGNFSDGKPEGTVTALQELVLEMPRYDYSAGTWENGKMNGRGTCGYIYYGQTGETDGLKTEKSGLFLNDRMEGELRYTSINNSGDSSTWHITGKAGVTVIDGRWDFDESQNVYMLPAENDKSHVYSLKGDAISALLWANRILWQN